MSKSNDQFYSDFINDSSDVASMDLSNLQEGSLSDFLEPFKTSEDFPNMVTPSSVSLDTFSQGLTTLSFTGQSTVEHLQMIEQPYQSSKLRYRADYTREKGRLGVLKNKNEKSKMKGPAIRIPQHYLKSNNEYYIRVSLVTIKYKKTNLHYFHPYELEHAKSEAFNDRPNNSVWFPIESSDSIKDFPLLRIVKKKASHVQKLDQLRVFDYHQDVRQYSPENEIDIIKEYHLEKSQLAFTLGKIILLNGQSSMHAYLDTTIFSDQMDEYDERQSDSGIDRESSSERSSSSSSNPYIYKYAPQSGIIGNNDEMLIVFKKNLEIKKYGNVQVTFKYDASEGLWSQSIINLDIKDRIISFKIPKFPYSITNSATVDIVLRQDNRILGVLEYSYLAVR